MMKICNQLKLEVSIKCWIFTVGFFFPKPVLDLCKSKLHIIVVLKSIIFPKATRKSTWHFCSFNLSSSCSKKNISTITGKKKPYLTPFFSVTGTYAWITQLNQKEQENFYTLPLVSGLVRPPFSFKQQPYKPEIFHPKQSWNYQLVICT